MRGGHHTGANGLVFDIQGCLGRGGFGEVYLATMVTPTGVRCEVAVKALRSDLDPGSDAIKRLRDEGRMLGALRHPSILSVHDLVMLDNRVALVTEYVDGLDLLQLIREQPSIPLRPLLTVIGDVASALSAAWHAPLPDGGQPMRLVHRDIKPANIRLGRHGEVKLLDFGVARAASLPREAQTQTNMALGSLGYMSPERFVDEEVAPPSDVYSLGCTLYEGLAQRRVFPKADFRSVMLTMARPAAFVEHLRVAMEQIPATVPAPVCELLERMLRPNAAERPTADEVSLRCEDLSEALNGPSLRRWCTDRVWPEVTHIEGASLRPGRVTAATFDQWEVRLAQGEPPRRAARSAPPLRLPNVITDRPPPVRIDGPVPLHTSPLLPERRPSAPDRTPHPVRQNFDPQARFGIDDLSDAEFERELRVRDRRVRGRRVLVVLVLGAVVAGAGGLWWYPTQARSLVDRAIHEVRAQIVGALEAAPVPEPGPPSPVPPPAEPIPGDVAVP